VNTLLPILQSVNDIFWIVAQVVLLTCAYWIILRIFRHTQGIYTLFAVVFFWLAVNFLNSWVNVSVITYLADGLVKILPLALVILFQDEIRRFLAHPMVWVRRFALQFRLRRDRVMRGEVIRRSVDELVKGVCCLTTDEKWRAFLRDYYHVDLEKERLQNVNTGALIALEGITGLEEIRGAGEQLDCEINYRLIRTIFYPGTALHDGGVILRMTRSGLHITAAGCRFPMATKSDGPVHARTNAAHGMAERTDAFVLMVSEERGSVLRPDEEDPHRMHRFESPQELRESLIEFCRQNERAIVEVKQKDVHESAENGESGKASETVSKSESHQEEVAEVKKEK